MGGGAMGGISLKAATSAAVHDVILGAHRHGASGGAGAGGGASVSRQDAARVLRWLAHMDARIFKPPPPPPLPPSPDVKENGDGGGGKKKKAAATAAAESG
jgi:hypothetical protein